MHSNDARRGGGRQRFPGQTGVPRPPLCVLARVHRKSENFDTITGTDVRITLFKGDLRGITEARRLYETTIRNIRQKLFLAFVYNAAAAINRAGYEPQRGA